MCFNSVTKKHYEIDPNETEWKLGWKAFIKMGDTVYFPFAVKEGWSFPAIGLSSGEVRLDLQYDTVLTANQKTAYVGDGQWYTSGFHILMSKEEADAYIEAQSFFDYETVVLPVKYRKVICEGIQTVTDINDGRIISKDSLDCVCVVALEMLVEKENA